VDWAKVASQLSAIDWTRSNVKVWEGRAMIGGRVSKASQNVTLTANVIKQYLQLPLTPEEQRVEDAYSQGRNHG
jgi:DNA sulfur modification protein DndB